MSITLSRDSQGTAAEAGLSLLELLLEAQQINPQRYVSEEAVNEIAKKMNVSRSRVYSTASFYSEISLTPRGAHLIRVCCNAPCENAGKTAILNAIRGELNVDIDETTGDGLFSLESVNCLGACYMSPAIRVDDNIYGNLTPEEAVRIIRDLKEEK